ETADWIERHFRILGQGVPAGILAAVVVEDEAPGDTALGVLERQEKRADPIIPGGHREGGVEAAEIGDDTVAALHRGLDFLDLLGLDRRQQAKTKLGCPLQPGETQLLASRIGADREPLVAKPQDRREQKLLAGGIPDAVAVTVDPDAILGIGK